MEKHFGGFACQKTCSEADGIFLLGISSFNHIFKRSMIIKMIPSNSYKIVLDLHGNELDSIELSKKISNIFTYDNEKIVFIIGGSLGLSKDVIDMADYKLCFSKMTFPHQLMQFILLEQIYRSFKIINNEKYHK